MSITGYLTRLRAAPAPALAVVEFSGYADNHPFAPNFSLGTVDFRALDSNGKLFVNLVAAEKGLQFEQSGVAATQVIFNGIDFYTSGSVGNGIGILFKTTVLLPGEWHLLSKGNAGLIAN